MKNFLFLLFTSLALMCNAQTSFQKGYVIDNTNKKFQCYIKNIDWKKNPTSIIYKLNENSPEKTLIVSQLKEFRINDTDNFYKRYSINKELVGSFFEEMQLSSPLVLLQVLVDGDADLFEYHTNGKYYFFYEKEGDLVFLDYKKTIDENNRVRKNEKFKRQLFDNFKCDNFTLKDYSKLKYNSTKLSNFFSEYNQCYGGNYINLHSKRTKPKVYFKVKGGLNLNSKQTNENAIPYILSYSIPPFSGNPFGEDVVKSFGGVENYNTNNNFSFGVELEVRLPFNQNNWSVFISPNYQNVSEVEGSKSFSEANVANFDIMSSLSYSFIQIPIGFRHYFDINDKLEIYAHLAYVQNIVLDFDQSTQVNEVPISMMRPYDFISGGNRVKTSNSGGFLGIGVNLFDKYALEINYYSQGLNLDDDYQVNMKGLSINASYTIF